MTTPTEAFVVSLLDIIGPVMVGPSSSHTAGACRLGLLARCLVGGTPQRARVELHGSFARTGEGHGTDKAIVGGLLFIWLILFAFVGIQMGWVLRPFVGTPNKPVQFFRQGAWSNAYIEVADTAKRYVRKW